MSRDHSLALALSSTATCSSLKTYIWPLGMICSWAHLFELHFTQGVFVCVCACVSVHARGSPGHLVPVTEIAERLICHMRPNWRLRGASSRQRVCVCVHVCACSWISSHQGNTQNLTHSLVAVLAMTNKQFGTIMNRKFKLVLTILKFWLFVHKAYSSIGMEHGSIYRILFGVGLGGLWMKSVSLCRVNHGWFNLDLF